MINLTTEQLRNKINQLVSHSVVVETFTPEGGGEGYKIDRISIWKHEVAGELFYQMQVYGFDFVNDEVLDLCPSYEDLKNVVNQQNENLVDAYFS